MTEFSIVGEVKRRVSETAALYFWRAEFDLLRSLIDEVPWEAVLMES